MTAICVGWPVTACGRSCEVTNGSFVAAKLTEGPRASAAASGKSGCRVWVGSSRWQDGEAAVRCRPTLERQMTSTLLPDCAIKLPAAEAENRSRRPARMRRCCPTSVRCGRRAGSTYCTVERQLSDEPDAVRAARFFGAATVADGRHQPLPLSVENDTEL